MSRQDQRQQQRARLKRGEALLRTGLPLRPEPYDLVAGATLIERCLADASKPNRASEAAFIAHRINAQSSRKTPGTQRLACRSGCGYCCHTWVAATAPEVFLVARMLRAEANSAARIADVSERAARVAGLDAAARFGAKLPCPLLSADGACTAYTVRPAVCRQVTAFDLAGCLDEFEGRDFGGKVQMSSIHLTHATNAYICLVAALNARRLDTKEYEFGAALQRALAEPDIEARWLAGEDVFAGLLTAPRAAQSEQGIAELARALEPAPVIVEPTVTLPRVSSDLGKAPSGP